MINKYTDPIITNYRFDKVGSRASVPITESLTVNNGFLFLKEIPDRNNVVTIGNLVEVQKPEELDSETKFYIDYNAGIVYFDSKLNGTKVNVEYSGIGIVYYPASRIYLEVDENHEIIRTLSDIEGQLSSLTNLKNQQERLKQEIEERNGNLNKTIEEARKIDLSGSVDKANQAKTDLEGTTRKANIADANLRTDIEFAKGAKIDLKKQEEQSKVEVQKSVDLANTTKTSLDGSITSANEKINKASEKVNEISSKIVEANTAEQKLANTKNDITTSLSDYDKKSAEIKLSSKDIESKNNELKSTIFRADESNTTLNISIKKSEESIKKANDININIDSSIAKYKETEVGIKAENEKATKNISDLDTKSASGKQVIDDLNSATLKSETAKTNLDESNTKAIQANTDLKTTTQTANDTKTSLEQIKNESSTLSNELSEGNTTASSNIESLKSENQSARTNITGLQTENQNALSKQETLSSETAKANEAIERIAELITSSTDLKNKLEQIVASGDLDKYITDPKLREILTAYATKDDLNKIDVTSQLIDYAKKTEIPTSLSQLTDDETHRLVTDEEKNKWNNPPNPDLTDYVRKVDLDSKIDKADIVHSCMGAAEEDKVLSQRGGYELMEWTNRVVMGNINFLKRQIPDSISQLTNDTKFKTEAEIQEMIANSSKLKKEVTTSLPTTGKDDVIYLVKDTNGKDNNNYLEYLWINGKWELVGSTQVDLSGYATKSEVKLISDKQMTQAGSIIKNEQDIQGLQNNVKSKLSKTSVIHIPSPSQTDGVYSIGVVNQIQSEMIMNFQTFQNDVINETNKKLDKSDLSPFTQQELEEAFK